jgi:hypothetical protein
MTMTNTTDNLDSNGSEITPGSTVEILDYYYGVKSTTGLIGTVTTLTWATCTVEGQGWTRNEGMTMVRVLN